MEKQKTQQLSQKEAEALIRYIDYLGETAQANGYNVDKHYTKNASRAYKKLAEWAWGL